MARNEGQNYRRWRIAGQARLAFFCALGLFIGGQIALEAAIHIWWPELHDWDFGVKLRILRASIAEKRAGQPVVVVLGSSRAALGVRPDLASGTMTGIEPQPVLFNFAFPGSGPVRELLALRRLVGHGIRPDLLIIECWPPFMGLPVASCEAAMVEPTRAEWPDLRVLKKYSSTPRQVSYDWFRSHLIPCFYSRKALRWRCFGEPTPPVLDPGLSAIAALGGYNWHEGLLEAHLQQSRREAYQKMFAQAVQSLTVGDIPNRALREMLIFCQHKSIPVALLYMPEEPEFKRWYPPAVQAHINAYLAGLSKEFAVPLVDARDWLPAELFSDHVHLLPAGSVAFTERLARQSIPQLLRDYAAGQRFVAN